MFLLDSGRSDGSLTSGSLGGRYEIDSRLLPGAQGQAPRRIQHPLLNIGRPSSGSVSKQEVALPEFAKFAADTAPGILGWTRRS